MMEPRRIVLIGATGSIGQNTLAVIRGNPERLRLVGVAAGSNAAKLEAIAAEFGVRHTCLHCRDGDAGLEALATLPEADMVVMAAVGTVGLRPTLAAIAAGKTIALASKEILVLAGEFVMAAARRHGVAILPVDSEHNAIFQCLQGARGPAEVRRLLLTASGGAFRDWDPARLGEVTPELAVCHPNWSMGPKITVDSSTMANKGLELIEARWLFDVTPSQVEVVIHPQSLVHSMVEFIDGSILAQLAPPSMTFAIQHALLHPERRPGVTQTLDFSQVLRLDFRPPDEARYPCLRWARTALQAGGVLPGAFNAANEVAVAAFLERRLPYLGIPGVIAEVLAQTPTQAPRDLADVLAADAAARAQASERVARWR